MFIKPKQYQEIDFDSPATSRRALEIIRSKKCLYDIYIETYKNMMVLKGKYLTDGNKILEIGSGGGVISDVYPDVITSDVTLIDGVDMVVDAQHLPFEDNSVDAIFAMHVIHHIPDITKFLSEANRVLKLGGGIVCVEPYWSPVAKLLYNKVHPEPFNENAQKWQLDSGGPMTGSNQALSFLLLKRDRVLFKNLFPNLKLVYQRPHGFIRYIATGGVWLNPLKPYFLFTILKGLELLISPLMPFLAIHHTFVLRKI